VGEADPVVKEVLIDASPEEIFPYLVRADLYVLWMGLTAELDPRAGGIYRVDTNGRNVIRGEYLEVVQPRRVVFTFGFEEPGHPVPPGSTTVEIELVPQGPRTLLRLVHRRSPPERSERHREGWTHYLGRLTVVAAGGDPGKDAFADPGVSRR